MSYLPCVEINPAKPADATVIWLHGLGADGHDFKPVIPELGLPDDTAIRFIFPHAPSIPVTINGGSVMPAWYDIDAMDIDNGTDNDGLLLSAARISDLIDREIERNIDSSRIMVVGFSQGGAVAYQVALTYTKALAGLMALSTYLANSKSIVLNPKNRTIPVRIYHGTFDPVVPTFLGEMAYKKMRQEGYDVIYKTYPMAHTLCTQEIQDIAGCLREILL